jgi:hypothetical protein
MWMPDTNKNDLSPDDAKADAKAAIEAGATNLTLERKADTGNWDLKFTTPPAAAGPGV